MTLYMESTIWSAALTKNLYGAQPCSAATEESDGWRIAITPRIHRTQIFKK